MLSFEETADSIVDRITQPRAVFLLVCLFVFAALSQNPVADPDLFARVAAGHLIALSGKVPITDPFAYTAKKALWIDHEWLAALIFYGVSRGGDLALQIVRAVGAFASIGVLLAAQRIYSPKARSGFVLLLAGAMDSSYVWTSVVRSQLFTYFFLPLYLLIFVLAYCRRAYFGIIFLPIVMLIWANAHGGFVVGLGLHALAAGAFLVERREGWLYLAGTFVVSVLIVAFLNPYPGFSFGSYMIEAITMPRPTITEWGPLRLSNPASWTTIGIGLLVFGGLATTRKLPPLHVGLFLASACFFAARANRLAAIFSMVAVVYGADYVDALFDAFGRRGASLLIAGKRMGAVATCVIALFCVAHLAMRLANGTLIPLSLGAFPVQSLEWLRANGKDGKKILVDFNAGSYALWRLYPKMQISMDGRYEEVYPESTVTDVADALYPDSPTWAESWKKTKSDYVLLPVRSVAFRKRQMYGADLGVVYQDEKFALLARPEDVAANPEPAKVGAAFDEWQPVFSVIPR
jgi:hypothetical protein